MFKLKNRNKLSVVFTTLVLGLSLFLLPVLAGADSHTDQAEPPSQRLEADCHTEEGQPLTAENCGIVKYLLLFINGLSALVGLVIVTMITVGGIQYSVTRDNPQAVQAARQRIYNAIIALVIYLFSFAFLQWVVPGGIF